MQKHTIRSGFRFFGLFIIVSILLSACGAGGAVSTGSDGTIVWLDQPMTNYMLPMSPFTLIAHAGHPRGGISQVEFMVNGVSVGTVATDTSLEFLRADTVWNPSGPGLYTIQAQATSPGGVTFTRTASICVVAGITSPQAWSGDCNATAGAPFTVNFNLNPNPVFFGSCPLNSLQFDAIFAGDTSSITGMQASWSFTNLDGTAATLVSGESGLPMIKRSDTSYTYNRDFTNAARDFGLTAGGSYLINASISAVDSSGNLMNTQTAGPFTWTDCTGTPTGTAAVSPSATPAISVTRTIAPTVRPLATNTPIVVPTICAGAVIDAVVTDGSTWNASWAPFVTLCIGGDCKNPNSSGTAEWSLAAGSYTITSSSSAYAVSPSTIPITLSCGEKSVNNLILSIP